MSLPVLAGPLNQLASPIYNNNNSSQIGRLQQPISTKLIDDSDVNIEASYSHDCFSQNLQQFSQSDALYSALLPSSSMSTSSCAQNFHNVSDPCAHVVHVLLCYHQGGEDPEFIRKAIESLVKKLKDRRMQLDSLISAVTSGGKQTTGCVTIHRSLDGRLQVAGRKGVPHVVYARIWRWPNVNKNELQKLPLCTTPNEHPDLICINPFHYDRVVSSGLSSIEMSSLRMDPLVRLGEDSTEQNYSPTQLLANTRSANFPTMEQHFLKEGTQHFQNVNYSHLKNQDNVNSVKAHDESSSNTSNHNSKLSVEKSPFLMFGPNQQPSCVVSHFASGSTISNRQLPCFQQQQQQQEQFAINPSINAANTLHFQAISSNAPQHSIFRANDELVYHQQQNQQERLLQWPETSNQINQNMLFNKVIPSQNDNRNAIFDGRNNDSMDGNNDAESSKNYRLNSGNDTAKNTYGVQRYNNLRHNLDQVRIPYTTLPEHWCTVLYYELDTQVGEAFKASRDLSEVIVDGGMDPSGGRSGRFCLGALSNVHRTSVSEKARIHIGKGIKLRTTEDGSVYLKSLSQKGVFVRSYFLDFEHGLIYGSTVHKFCSGAEKKLFDLRWAFAEMCEQRESAQMAVVAQAYAVAGIVPRVAPSLIERAGIGVDDLRRVCCTIAISFVKGWGSGYNRSSIKETPCWVEVHLHRPLQLLNFLLQKTE